MKKLFILGFAFLGFLPDLQAQCPDCKEGRHITNSTNWKKSTTSYHADTAITSSLGVIFDSTGCGLNYVQSTIMTTTRYTSAPGKGIPTPISVSGLPPCYTIIKAYLYAEASCSDSNYTTKYLVHDTVSNPTGATQVFPSVLAGTSGPKCWGEIGSGTWRCDITGAISGNGNYKVDLSGFSNLNWEVDGVAILIIYKDNTATYTGTLTIADGETSVPGGIFTYNMPCKAFCTNSSSTSFMMVADMQNNVSPTWADSVNGTTATYNRDFFQYAPITTSTKVGQTSIKYVINDATDCYAVFMVGNYFQSSCQTCSSHIAFSSVNANCNTPGSATANSTFCTGPYTYLWSNGQTTQTATGLSTGTYTVTVTSTTDSVTFTDSVTIQNLNTLGGNVHASSQPKCDSANGSITVAANSGSAPYTYSWNNGATTASITNLSAGTYTCAITDSNGCTKNVIYTLSNLGGPTVTFKYSGADTLCTIDSAVTLNNGSPAGGTFSGNGVTGTQFNPSSANIGWNNITYSYTDSNGCVGANTDSIFVKNCVFTGIVPLTNANDFNIYPNPSHGLLNITSSKHLSPLISVYNSLGQLVAEAKASNGSASINITTMPAGVYCIRITDGTGFNTVKTIIKQ